MYLKPIFDFEDWLFYRLKIKEYDKIFENNCEKLKLFNLNATILLCSTVVK